jgi:hypothetical protein
MHYPQTSLALALGLWCTPSVVLAADVPLSPKAGLYNPPAEPVPAELSHAAMAAAHAALQASFVTRSHR